jgi:hypothetical protein
MWNAFVNAFSTAAALAMVLEYHAEGVFRCRLNPGRKILHARTITRAILVIESNIHD